MNYCKKVYIYIYILKASFTAKIQTIHQCYLPVHDVTAMIWSHNWKAAQMMINYAHDDKTNNCFMTDKPKNHQWAGKSTIPAILLYNVRNSDHHLIDACHLYSPSQEKLCKRHNTQWPHSATEYIFTICRYNNGSL